MVRMIVKLSGEAVEVLKVKKAKIPSWCLVVAAGVMIGLNSPGHQTQLVGMIALLPLFIVFERIHINNRLFGRRMGGWLFVSCWAAGGIAATIGVPWMTTAAHLFGKLPWSTAIVITAFGYGLEIALVLFVCFGMPILFIRNIGHWDLLVRICYFIAVEPFCPRLLHWSFGGLTFDEFPYLSQAADLVGASGLGVFSVGFTFLLLLVWRRKVLGIDRDRRILFRASITYFMLLFLGMSYGLYKTFSSKAESKSDVQIRCVAIQPDFSFQQLYASSLDLSVRKAHLKELQEDSIIALNEGRGDELITNLVIWPESAYPGAFFKDSSLRSMVTDFVARYNCYVLFHSVDWKVDKARRRFYGIAVLLGPDGEIKGRYDKIFRIPFGEYIPGAERFPGYAEYLRKHIANISEFEAGTEYTVFELPKKARFCAPICFDVVSPSIVRDMARSGAEMAINLSNLIWFGNSTASDHLEMSIRWNAIENRIPIYMVSNNGESMLIDAMGRVVGSKLGLFERGCLTHTVKLMKGFSLYRDYREEVYLTFWLLFIASTILVWKKGKIFQMKQVGSRNG